MGGTLGKIGAIGGGIAGGVFGGPAGAAAGSSIGGSLGGMLDGDPNKKANAAKLEALRRQEQAYRDQIMLNPEDYVADYQEIDPELLSYYTPEMEAAEQVGDTALAGIQTDPALKQQQMQALSKLAARADQGLTLGDLAARNELMDSAGQANRGAQEAVLQSMARRGQLGGGQELAARMAAAQGSYGDSAKEMQALAAARENNALQAALQSGNLAGSMRDQDYGEQATAAKARDAIAQFNLNQRANVQQRNVGSKNEAAQGSADLRNQAYTTNLGLTNKQADQRVSGLTTTTAARNQAALGAAGANVNSANAAQQQGAANAARKQSQFEGLVQGGLGAYGAFSKPSAGAVQVAGQPVDMSNNINQGQASNEPEYYDSLTNSWKKGDLRKMNA